jgi:hypothetical protein
MTKQNDYELLKERVEQIKFDFWRIDEKDKKKAYINNLSNKQQIDLLKYAMLKKR